MMMNLTLERPVSHLEVRVIGIGGAGCSSLRNLNEFLPGNTRFLGIDTGSGAAGVRDFADAIRIGDGFGSGGDAVAAAELFVDSYESNEYREKVIRFVSGADVVIIVAGLGRGTGSGIAPLVAPIARESGALTLAAVHLPFEFEGRFRHKFAVQALEKLQNSVDSVIVAGNNDLLGPEMAPSSMSLAETFREADRRVSNSVKAVVSALNAPAGTSGWARQSLGLRSSGKSVVLSASSPGLHGGKHAVDRAFEDMSSGWVGESELDGVRSVVVHVEGGIGMSAGQVEEAVAAAKARTGDHVEVHVSTSRDVALGQQIRVTLILAGIGSNLDLCSTADSRQTRQSISDGRSFDPLGTPVYGTVPVDLYPPVPFRRRGPALLPAG